MIKSMVIFLIFILSLPLYAAENKRKSYLSLNTDFSSNEYRNFFLGGAYGINSIWQMGLLLSRSSDKDANKYQSGAVFVSAKWNEIISNKLKLSSSKEEPDEISGKGAELITRFNNPIFHKNYTTSFEFTLGTTQYEQETVATRSLGTITATRDFIQRYFALDLSQDLTTWMLIGVRYTAYSYEDASSASFTGKNNKFQASQSVDGVSEYPDKKYETYATFFIKDFTLDLSLQKTVSNVSENDSFNRTFTISYALNDSWEISSGISSTKYEDDSKNDTLSVGVDFTF